MIRIYCDICDKEITSSKQFKSAIIYETLGKMTNRKMAHKKDFCLCEECNKQMVEKIKKILEKCLTVSQKCDTI